MNKLLITSIGRTGTVSLTDFLNSLPGVNAYHERKRQDVPFLFLSQTSNFKELSSQYLKERDALAEDESCDHYVEVNPYLRFTDAQQLKALGWNKVMLSRHPKTYLESVFTRRLYQDSDVLLDQLPQDGDPMAEGWFDRTRFEKLCWYYSKVANFMLDSEVRVYKFEELIKGGEVLKQFLQDNDLPIPADSSLQLPKRNASGASTLKARLKTAIAGKDFDDSPLDWNALSQDELKTFNELCAPVAKKLGYVLQ